MTKKWDLNREYLGKGLPSRAELSRMTFDTLSVHAMHVAAAILDKGGVGLAVQYLLENLDPDEYNQLRDQAFNGYEAFRKAHSKPIQDL